LSCRDMHGHQHAKSLATLSTLPSEHRLCWAVASDSVFRFAYMQTGFRCVLIAEVVVDNSYALLSGEDAIRTAVVILVVAVSVSARLFVNL
jgi:hypothetical protein